MMYDLPTLLSSFAFFCVSGAYNVCLENCIWGMSCVVDSEKNLGVYNGLHTICLGLCCLSVCHDPRKHCQLLCDHWPVGSRWPKHDNTTIPPNTKEEGCVNTIWSHSWRFCLFIPSSSENFRPSRKSTVKIFWYQLQFCGFGWFSVSAQNYTQVGRLQRKCESAGFTVGKFICILCMFQMVKSQNLIQEIESGILTRFLEF